MESALIRKIREHVASLGGKVIKFHADGYAEAGTPDLIVILSHATYFVETKDWGKKPTRLQYARIAEINRAGGKAFWTDNLEDFTKRICS